jgi:hypothetical protein
MSELTDSNLPIPGQTVLRGSLVEQFAKARELEQVSYLNEVVMPLAKDNGGFAMVLGGNSHLSLDNTYALNLSFLRKDPRYSFQPQSLELARSGFAKAWDTGADLNKLVRELPQERWKFYLSFDLPTPQQEQQAQSMFKELLDSCTEQKISLLTKSEDHNYDSCDLYTWDRDKMAEVLKKLYPKYQNIWQSVYHFFQASIPSVDSKHIGFVQEPIGGHNGQSHSGRMMLLGEALDSNNKIPISVEDFRKACSQAGVMSGAPWKIAA